MCWNFFGRIPLTSRYFPGKFRYMKRLDLRLPDELHQRLTETAAREMRSAHSQALLILAEGLANGPKPLDITLREPGDNIVTVEEVEAEVLEKLPVDKKQAKVIAQAHVDIAAGKAVDDHCTHRASHARTIGAGEACKGCGGTTW